MSTATKIILERLKTHPEEFVRLDGDIAQGGSWSILINNANRWATPEEIKDIDEGMIQARRLLADQVALQILSGEYYEIRELI
jgi:predicted metalloprotease